MGSFLNKPETQKYNESGEGNGLRYGVASMQGWRVEMEDAHHAALTLNGTLADWSYFGVFDGHAGARVSAHCAENLLECILQTEEFRRDDIAQAIRVGFLDLDEKMRELPELSDGEEKSGSTAVCAFVSPKQIYIANCGDSRAVLARDGKPIFATRDHKPELPSEKSRIVQAGGSVMIQRVNGSLAVSRALGDYEYKKVVDRGPCEQLVSPEPEVFVHERSTTADEFLVLACDGVWDVMTNEALCAYVHSLLQLSDDLTHVTNQVIDTCLYKGSKDNMSIVLVTFPAAPRPSAEAQRADRELDEILRQRLTGCYYSILHACNRTPSRTVVPPGGTHHTLASTEASAIGASAMPCTLTGIDDDKTLSNGSELSGNSISGTFNTYHQVDASCSRVTETVQGKQVVEAHQGGLNHASVQVQAGAMDDSGDRSISNEKPKIEALKDEKNLYNNNENENGTNQSQATPL